MESLWGCSLRGASRQSLPAHSAGAAPPAPAANSAAPLQVPLHPGEDSADYRKATNNADWAVLCGTPQVWCRRKLSLSRFYNLPKRFADRAWHWLARRKPLRPLALREAVKRFTNLSAGAIDDRLWPGCVLYFGCFTANFP